MDNGPVVHIAKHQRFVGSQWIAIFAAESNTPTLWIYYGDDMPANEKAECERYAEYVAAIINAAGPRGSDN